MEGEYVTVRRGRALGMVYCGECGGKSLKSGVYRVAKSGCYNADVLLMWLVNHRFSFTSSLFF